MLIPTRLMRSPPLLRRFKHYMFRSNINGFRPLYCDRSLKMDYYKRRRLILLDESLDGKSALANRLQSVTNLSEARTSFWDLVDMLYIAEKGDMELIKHMFRILSESKSMFEPDGSFHVGALFLRMCHHLQESDEAFTVFNDPDISCIFNDMSCYIILMDLLYENKQYDRVLDLFRNVVHQGTDIGVVTFALAACYHQNTIESFKDSKDIMEKYAKKSGLPRRAIMFAVYLALNQGEPVTAFESLMSIRSKNNMTVNLELFCQARMGNVEAIFRLLHKALLQVQEEVYRPLTLRLYSDTMSEVRQAIKNCGETDTMKDLQELEKELRKYGALSVQVSTAFIDKVISV